MKVYKLFPLLILLAFLIKTLIMPVSIGDAIILVGLASLYGFWTYLEFIKEPPVNKDIRDALLQQKELLAKTVEDVDNIKTFVTATKLTLTNRR